MNEKLKSALAATPVRETGLLGFDLGVRLSAAASAGYTGVAAALNNADTDLVLASLLKTEPENVMKGIQAAAEALDTENKALYVPESMPELAEQLAPMAEQYGIQVKCEFVNVRENESTFLMHIATAADLAHALDGTYVSGVWVSVDGADLKKVPDGTKVADLVDLENAKGLLLGYTMHKAVDASLTVEAAGITNGVVRVLRNTDCIVTETQKKLLASRARACGKCVFCREGLLQLEYEHKEITQGRGKAEFVDYTHEIGEAMTFSTMCTMGQNASKIALSAQDNFPEEFEAHIKQKKCPAGVCTSFVSYYIDPKICTGCGDCIDVCPADCIEGKSKFIHMIETLDCTRCGKCVDACDEGAVKKTSGKLPKLPDKLTKVGKFKR